MCETDLRVVRTLENIDFALLKSLTSFPFHKVTVDMLCKSARINRSTFYKYYKDKFDLLDKYIDRTLDEFSKHLKAEFIIATPSEVESLAYSYEFKNLLFFFNEKKDIYYTLLNASIHRDIYTEMTEIAQSNLLENLNLYFKMNSVQSEYASLFSYLFASNLMTVVSWWLKHEDHISIEEVVKLMDDTTSKGLFMTLKKILN